MTPDQRKSIASEVSDIIMDFLGTRYSPPYFSIHDVMLTCSKNSNWRELTDYSFPEINEAYSLAIVSVVEALLRIGFILPDQSEGCYIPGPLGSEEVITFAYSQKGG